MEDVEPYTAHHLTKSTPVDSETRGDRRKSCCQRTVYGNICEICDNQGHTAQYVYTQKQSCVLAPIPWRYIGKINILHVSIHSTDVSAVLLFGLAVG